MFSLNHKFFKPFKAFFSFLFSFKVLLFFIMFLSSVNTAHCLDLSFAWDANTEPDLAGYRVFYRQQGQNYDYNNPAWQGTETTCTIFGLDDNTSYDFVSRAYDIYGNESENSVELYHEGSGVPVTLTGLSISGNDSVNENSSAGYTATAFFSDSSTQTVTGSANWSENSSYASISGTGVLTTSEVSTDQTLTVQAGYTYNGVTETATKTVTILDVPSSNLPPGTPTIVYPEIGQLDVEAPLEITTEPFSDPNGDAHNQSQWQISEQSNFSTLVFDITSNSYLTALSVPHMVMKSNQTYYVRVRFYDGYSEGSDWSGSGWVHHHFFFQ